MIEEIAKKYDVLNEEINAVGKQRLKLGFLGEFNSGKSTLINALIGQKVLPAMNKPTTKNITEIYPQENISQKEYFKSEDKQWLPISATEFSELAMGEGDAKTKIVVQSNEFLNSEFILIDTPGISSLDKTDEDITYGYLPFLDGIVVCQDINQGALTASVINFLENPQTSYLANNIIFVLTKSDDKPSEQTQLKIKEAVIEQLKKHAPNIENPSSKVITVSAKDFFEQTKTEILSEVTNAIKMNFYDRYAKIKATRVQIEREKIAQELIDILNYRLENIDYSNTELDEKSITIKKELEDIENLIKTQKDKRNKLKTKLQDKLCNVCLSYKNGLLNPQTAEETTYALQANIQAEANQIIQQVYSNVGSLQIPNNLISNIQNHIKRVTEGTEMAKTVTTALIAAALSGGTSAAANAVEAAGGATLREMAKESAKNVAKNIVEEATKKEGIFGKIFQTIGEAIKAVNPVEHAADFLSGQYLDSYLEKNLKTISYDISDVLVYELEDYIEDELLLPLKKETEQKELSLKELSKLKQSSFEKIHAMKDEMILDRSKLQKLV